MSLVLAAVDWAAVSSTVAALALFLGGFNFIQAIRRDREATEMQRRLREIEETRHLWEQQDRAYAEAERRRAEEWARSASFAVHFRYKDQRRSWGNVVVTNVGPAMARDVALDVWGQRGSVRHNLTPAHGAESHRARRVAATESLIFGVHFTLGGGPSVEELHYRVTWRDDRGERDQEGRVPTPD